MSSSSKFVLLPSPKEMKTIFSIATEHFYGKYRYSGLVRMELEGIAESFLKILLEKGNALDAVKTQAKLIYNPKYYENARDIPNYEEKIFSTSKFARWVEQRTGKRFQRAACLKLQFIMEKALIQFIYLSVRLLTVSRRSTLYPKEMQLVRFLRLLYASSD